MIAAINARGVAERAEMLARLDALETLTERLVNRRASEDGQRGREKQRATKAAEDEKLADLQAAAQAAIAADLRKAPPLRKALRSMPTGAPPAAQDEGPDVVQE